MCRPVCRCSGQGDAPALHPGQQVRRFSGFGKVPVGSENRVVIAKNLSVNNFVGVAHGFRSDLSVAIEQNRSCSTVYSEDFVIERLAKMA